MYPAATNTQAADGSFTPGIHDVEAKISTSCDAARSHETHIPFHARNAPSFGLTASVCSWRAFASRRFLAHRQSQHKGRLLAPSKWDASPVSPFAKRKRPFGLLPENRYAHGAKTTSDPWQGRVPAKEHVCFWNRRTSICPRKRMAGRLSLRRGGRALFGTNRVPYRPSYRRKRRSPAIKKSRRRM